MPSATQAFWILSCTGSVPDDLCVEQILACTAITTLAVGVTAMGHIPGNRGQHSKG
jgi:hypothetical protein